MTRQNKGTILVALFIWLVTADAKRVAIIGGGVSGTFAAKYLADYDEDCDVESITIFDPMPIGEPVKVNQQQGEDWQGSRVASLQLDDGHGSGARCLSGIFGFSSCGGHVERR